MLHLYVCKHAKHVLCEHWLSHNKNININEHICINASLLTNTAFVVMFCKVLLWLPVRVLRVKKLQLLPSKWLRGCHGYWAAGCRGIAIVTWQRMRRGHCGYLIVRQCVETLPVAVDLSGDVFVLENDTSHATLTPLWAEKTLNQPSEQLI